MKKGILAAFLISLSLGYILQAEAGIAGSAHDFSSQGWSGGQICEPCHTPHNASTAGPLWNHAVSAASYTLYASGTMDAGPAQPAGVSLLCLSCHDGTVALDSFGGATGTNTITGSALVGTDLSNDHPISFAYDSTLASSDGELHDPSTASTTLGGTIDADLLFSGQLECASCHDVHDAAGNAFLLKIDNAGSALCLTCHAK